MLARLRWKGLSSRQCSGTPLTVRSLLSTWKQPGAAHQGLAGGDADTDYDAIIVGGGHNGLVCAAYMAKAGKKVIVLEKRHILGGAAVTEELYDGFRYSRGSYVYSLFRPTIAKDLELQRHGLRLFPRDPSSFTPMLDGRSLMLHRDAGKTHAEISKFSKKDADAFVEYEAWLERLVAVISPYLDAPPPEMTGRDVMQQIPALVSFSKRLLSLGKEIPSLVELLTAPSTKVLDRWFESEPLKATLATDAVVGAMMSPETPGSGYVLLHHIMGEVDGAVGAWAYVEGGMGMVSECIARAAREAGARLRCSTPVSHIVTECVMGEDVKKAVGVQLVDGTVLRSKQVVSNVTPTTTFQQLVDSDALPADFHKEIELLDTTSPVCKINVALDLLPDFACLPSGGVAGPQHHGTIHFGTETCQELHDAYMDAVYHNRPSQRPMIEMTLPSVLDGTLAPEGKHVASLFCQYAPYAPEGGWTTQKKEDFAETVFSVVEEYCPGFRSSVLHADILPPPELERVFGLTGGSITHAAMGLNQMFFLRPAKGWARHRTPVTGLYMCGAGTHPGGGVMGAAGRHASQVCLSDMR